MLSKMERNLLLSSDKFRRQEDYWLGKLSGELALPALLPGMKRPGVGPAEAGKVKITIPDALFHKLMKISKGNDLSLYLILLTGLKCLVHRYTSGRDIIIASPVLVRSVTPETINVMVAVRDEIDGDMTFKDCLLRIRQTALEAYENQDYPLEQVLDRLSLPQGEDGVNIFNIACLLKNIHHEMAAEEVKSDLVFSFEKNEEYIDGCITYNRSAFPGHVIERLPGHLANILDSAADDINTRLKDIRLLSEEEEEQLLVDFNPQEAGYSTQITICELFEEQVERTPEEVAVAFQDRQMTYKEFNERSNQLARVLRQKGVKPGCIVAILVERSLDMAVGIMGVLKAGGAYLPIDPGCPEDRMKYMLEDSGAIALVIGNRQWAMGNGKPIPVIHLDDESIYTGDGSNLERINTPNDLAYIIYTSGTTGKPKGVMIEHKGLSVRIQWRRDAYRLGREDSVLQLFSYAFDGFVTSFFTPVISGSRVVFLKDEEAKDPLAIRRCIISRRITHFISIPALFSAVLKTLTREEAESLRIITLAGEKVTPDVIEEGREKNGNLEIINEYGPTEGTVVATASGNLQPGSVITIGKPVANTAIYILDKNNRIQPVGVAGELCISGDGLARGYLNRPELTAERFVPNPFAPITHNPLPIAPLMYRTGDMARWLPDGNIDFLGRMDHQVKIRGFRVELGEIESCLLGHPAVKEAVVAAREESAGDRVLCAYFVPEGEVTVGELTEYLSGELPGYMVPSHFVRMERLPLTPGGKIDRWALPEPAGNMESGAEYAAPMGEMERKLVEMWQDILSIQKVGIDDNFFELGGHSLRATIIASQIYKEFDVEIPLTEIFNSPTVRGLTEYIRRSDQHKYASIETVEKREYYPASSAQKRMYLINQLGDTGISYNVPSPVLLEGNLDKRRFEETVMQLIERHEAFRMSFEMVEGELVQRIHDRIDFVITCEEVEEEKARDRIKEFVRPFDLGKAPLLRVGLFRLSENRHVAVFDMHHIISDGTSMGVFVREFVKLYEGQELSPLRVQYKDFAIWHNKLLETGSMKKQEEYWLDVFKGEIPVLNMPMDYPRPAVRSFEGDTVSVEAGRELTDALNRLAAKTGTTLYMVLLAAYNVLLSKYSGQEDIVVGSSISGRSHPDLKGIIGMFVNALAMRNYPVHSQTFAEFLESVRTNALKAFENQDYPFEELVEKLNIKRDLGRNPLFDTLLTMQNTDNPEVTQINLKGLELIPYGFEYKVSKFDIFVDAAERENGLVFNLEHCSRLFRKETVKTLAQHFINILAQVSENPGMRLSEIDMLGSEEKEQLLYRFNDTKAEYPADKTIHRLFEEQAERTPGSTALVLDNHELTYRELNEKANQLARVLREKGVKPESITGIISERSFEMVIGILAVLKAGGAYLPIDPSYPVERIAYMLEDSGAGILLMDNGQWAMDNAKTIEVINLKDESIYRGDSSNLDNINTPGDLVYVIYTSGSTGRPKGVMVTQQGLVNYIWWAQKVYLKGEKLDFPLYSSISFDLTVTSIFTPLITGNRIVIYNGPSIEKVIKDNRTGIVKLTPTHLKLLEEMDLKESGIKKLIVGGEDLKTELAKKIYDSFAQGVEIYNEYGPTETVVGCMIHLYDPEKDIRSSVPIGVPADNVQIYLLDEHLNPVPAGAVGEMYISGDGVARGYLSRPELTAEKFIPNPFNHCQLMYRTGDLARMMGDGRMEFLGRADHQVKIRGYRIETGEIETQLMKHPAVDEAAVTVIEEGGESSLCAYIVYRYDVTVTELKEYISKELPEYMMPSCFVRLEAMPMTANGKLDRKALPKPGPGISTGTEYEDPCNETEERLAALWQDLLNLERVGAKDNFFELGGHSLKAMMLGSRINREFGVDIQPRDIFEAPVLSALAERIRDGERKKYLQIEPAEEKEFYEVSSAQKRLFIIEQFKGRGTEYNVPALATINGSISREQLKELLLKLIRRHEAFRTSFEMMDNRPVQKIHREVDFDMEYMEASEEEVPGLIKAFIRPFDLRKAPLLRAALVKVEENKHVLMVDMHHIITDGVSMGILMKEMALLYRGAELPRLKIQYKDFSEWQNSLIAGGAIREQEKYWMKVFEGEIPVLNLPADYPRPGIQSFEGSVLFFRLGEELTARLKAFTLERNTTLYMVLLAAYNLLLSKYSGQEDIVVGSAVMGRTHADLENVIGMFINMLAMRNRPISGITFDEFLDAVRTNALNAYKNQDYQFEELVDRLNVPRDMSRSPLFDITFTMQNMDMNREELGSMGMESYKFEDTVSKYDLSLVAAEMSNDISFGFEYCTRLFDGETIQRMAGHFTNILAEIIKAPGKRLADIQMLSEEETRQILVDFNNTKAEYPQDTTIHRLFEQQVEKAPEGIAAVFEDGRLTYRELNEKANQLAYLLREKGIKPGSVAGIMADKSAGMLAGILGILKAGGAYLPIDPAYPQERITYMLEDSSAALLLTQKSYKDKAGLLGVETLIIDSSEIYMGEASNPEPVNTPEDLVYIMYTSGSTGRPKGVMIEHGGVVNLCNWFIARYGLQEGIKVLQFTNYIFDPSVEQIFSTLLSGATLYFMRNEMLSGKEKFRDYLEKNEINIVNLTPAVLREFLSDGDRIESVKAVICGGEKLDISIRNAFLDKGYTLYNHYGPTEATVDAVTGKCTYANRVVLGTPVANTSVYILDGNRRLQPVGVVGELYICGAGLARGYVNRPELTEESFVDNPFVPGERMYRTGDLARWLGNGSIEFIGRRDSQVKIRGFRIELGEIESRLLQYEPVKEAVVLVKEDKRGDRYLCAYAVADRELNMTDIRMYLAKELPNYMIPAYMIQLDKMPQTPNGKVDRRALPEPDGSINAGAGYAAPRNEAERKLADIWQEVLGIERVGVEDNFFDLGGHSLKAVNIVARAKKENIYISIGEIFKHRTIREILENSAGQESGIETGIGKLQEHEEGSRHILKFVPQNKVTAFLFRALPLCIVLAHDNMLPWFYQHFIQLCSQTEDGGRIVLDYVETFAPYGDIIRHDKFGYKDMEGVTDIVSFIKEKLDMGNYLIICLDEFYLSEKVHYHQKHFVHEQMIYGYDSSERNFIGYSFNRENMLDRLAFGWQEVAEAYEAGKVHYTETADYAAMQAVQVLSVTKEGEYPFDIAVFLKELHNYVFSTDENTRVCVLVKLEDMTDGIPPDRVKYGLATYDDILYALEKMLQGEMITDYRLFHQLADHKRGLYERLGYVAEKYSVSRDTAMMIEKYRQVVDGAEAIRIKAFESLQAGRRHSEEIEKVIKQVISNISMLREKERELLSKILEQLASIVGA